MKRIVFLVFLVFSSLLVSADGGMWVPLFLDSYNIEDMQQKGFKLSAEDINKFRAANDSAGPYAWPCVLDKSTSGVIPDNRASCLVIS